MKRVVTITALLIALAAEAFAGNGDLIVDGKVGIGTTNLTSKLAVATGSTVFSANTNTFDIMAEPSLPSGYARALRVGNQLNRPTSQSAVFGAYGYTASDELGFAYFGVTNASNDFTGYDSTKLITVGGSGNVGIGNATPEAKLNIVGELRLGKSNLGGTPTLVMTSNLAGAQSTKGLTAHAIFGPYDSTSGDTGSLCIGVGTSADGTRNDLNLYNHGCFGGTCNMKSANIYADTTYVSGTVFNSSDGRLKKDIAEITSSLEKLKQIKVVTYKWKDKGMGEDSQLGVIAQDVEAIFPELVKEFPNQLYLHSENKEELLPKIKAVDYGKLAAIALQGVKELSSKVDNLEERLLKLENLLSAGRGK